MRRSGARSDEGGKDPKLSFLFYKPTGHQQGNKRTNKTWPGQRAPLPPDIVVRTPSPIQPSALLSSLPHGGLSDGCQPLPMHVMKSGLLSKLHGHPGDITQLLQNHPYPAILDGILHQTTTTGPLNLALKYDAALSDLPWNMLMNKVFSTIFAPLQAEMNVHGAPKFSLRSAICADPGSSLPTSNFDIYHFLAEAFYQISNNRSGWKYKHQCPEVVNILLNQVPKGVFAGLFQIDLPSVRSIWECLVSCAGKFAFRHSFNFLIHIGFQHKRWILPRGTIYLRYAASMGATDIVRSLLEAGARADGDDDDDDVGNTGPLIEAAATGNLQCLELLLQKCDVNRVLLYYGNPDWTIFGQFLFTLRNRSFSTSIKHDHTYLPNSTRQNKIGLLVVDFNLDNESITRALHMLLERGADVDSILPKHPVTIMGKFYNLKQIITSQQPTFLEESYAKNRKLFDILAPYSIQSTQYVTRSGICLAAKQGLEALEKYMLSLLPRPGLSLMEFVELVFAEQFLSPDVPVDTEVVLGLAKYGIDPKRAELPEGFGSLLCYLIVKAHMFDSNQDFLVLLRLLLNSGAVIDDKALEASIVEEGIVTLLLLSQHGANVRNDGGAALARAARLDNYEAVSWLLKAGVDINGVVDTYSEYVNLDPKSIIALASTSIHEAYFTWGWIKAPSFSANCEMIEYLTRHGAELKSDPNDPNAFNFLRYLLNGYDDMSLHNKIELFMNLNLIDAHDLVGPDCLLETSFTVVNPSGFAREQRLIIFELLLECGAPVKNSSVLASLIYNRARPELIQTFLQMDGVDINAYARDRVSPFTPVQAAAYVLDIKMVKALVSMGADINKPSFPESGLTALQAALVEANTIEERAEKMKMVKFLIDIGAEINHPRTGDEFSALKFAASEGNIELVLLLIHHGADPNLEPTDGSKLRDLDIVAQWGMLDMVKLFLNIGALSGDPGETGYDGAIYRAEKYKRFTIADMIREHAAMEKKVFGGSLAMSFYPEKQRQDDSSTR
ncbi:hypothetical protein M426DRAFT_219497 [Hypoxylon sp. CI-4A]|nr:hypothetical protein M426DRAFT_219497 [Hypoxylon sp. CI-4A]